MNIKALITTAVLIGSSTVALASPRDHRTNVAANAQVDLRFGNNVRDHRTPVRVASYQTPTYQPEYIPEHQSPAYEAPSNRWFTVGSFNYRFDGKQVVELGCEGRPVTTMRIVSGDPNSEIYTVIVHNTDGTSHTYLWNHVFGSATDGQTGPTLVMGFAPHTMIKSFEILGRSTSRAGLSVQIQS